MLRLLDAGFKLLERNTFLSDGKTHRETKSPPRAGRCSILPLPLGSPAILTAQSPASAKRKCEGKDM